MACRRPSLRHPTWNPVLFQPRSGPLMLFYKVGPSPSTWWGMVMTSADGGRTWSPPRRLPDGVLGPIKNKPVQLANGDILSGSSTEHDGWRVHFERSSDNGATWTATPPLNDGKEIPAIQPSILVHRTDACRRSGAADRRDSSRPGRPIRDARGPADAHGTTECERRNGCRHAQRRPFPAGLQPHGHGPQPAQRRDLDRRPPVDGRSCPREPNRAASSLTRP